MNDIVTNSIIDNYKFAAENWKRMYEEKKEEIERLNNIINELEKWGKENFYINGDEVADKIKELRGNIND